MTPRRRRGVEALLTHPWYRRGMDLASPRLHATLLVVLAASCSSHQRPPRALSPAAPSFRIIDATAAFFAFWGAHSASPPEVQAAAFRRIVVGTHPELFGPGVIGVDPTIRGSDLDQRLGPFLSGLPGRIQAMREVHGRLGRQLERFDRAFRTLFPDMKWSGTVYVTISVDAFDGAVRRVKGKPCLLFGIDKIAAVHGRSGNLGPFFHHELFHVYHDDVNPPPPMTESGPHGLLQPLWQEGLAVYVSHLLHPGASATELLLTAEMVRDGPAVLPRVAAEFARLLDDARESDYRDLFLGKGKRKDIPRRFAYYVGYLVAKAAARRHPLAELVQLRGPRLRQIVDRALAEIGRGSTGERAKGTETR